MRAARHCTDLRAQPVTGRTVFAAAIAIAIVCGSPVRLVGRAGLLSASTQDHPREFVSVTGPRPLSDVIVGFETHCQCVITYEDPKWEADQVVDAPVRHPPNVHPHIPRGGPLAFGVDGMIPNSPESTRRYLELAVNLADEKGYGAFEVATSGERVFHVRPRAGSVLTAPITFASQTKEMGQFVTAILSDVHAANGEQADVVMGVVMGPPDLMKIRVTAEADDEPADLVLTRVLLAAGPRLSWELVYDFDSQAYALNVHVVEAGCCF
jgi:hypothetical protein